MDDSEPLDWEGGQPRSRRFGDIYFSRTGGLDETRHVFLEGNRLPERFAALPGGGRFVIGETGFGTGLNFLSAWRLFEALAPDDAQLDFVSTELYPLSAEDLARALGSWPELSPWTELLLRQYGALAPGWHRFDFAPRRARLTLLVGDARQTLPDLHGTVDAWFLDGFAPSRNPQLWEPALLATLGRLSAPGCTLATYSCAGPVRRALDAAGFSVRKVPGFGAKREMLAGEHRAAAWSPRRATPSRAAVVGAGLAGCAVAAALARRGWQVDLLDRHGRIAVGSSGNTQGMLYARLSSQGGLLSRLVGHGYQHSLRVLRRLLPCDGDAWSDAPLLQLAVDAHEKRRQEALGRLGWPAALMRAVDRQEAQALAGVSLPAAGVVFPSGGWVHPPALCEALAATPGVRVRTGLWVRGAQRRAARWILDVESDAVEADVVVLANAGDAREFAQAAHLPLRLNRGQVTLLPTPVGAALHAVVCGERYVAPARRGLMTTGATFERIADAAARSADNVENVAALRALVPTLHEALTGSGLDCAVLQGRAGLRCVSPDYLPLAGPLRRPEDSSCAGLYASLAHGSRGLITAPICGDLIADLIDGTPALLPSELVHALHPARFPLSPQPPAPSL